ncbi:hypothetical protein CHS0354_035797 [Potamilus streckersoni]|uniref:Uncharacterized protein n=1 Tax=Potamilus streckersoni TaxID=2493646 RepID=A0AAE0SWV3_9BIVA|nr:hypothetical protein CHS0354_035797 [Potamilus streckersoni]
MNCLLVIISLDLRKLKTDKENKTTLLRPICFNHPLWNIFLHLVQSQKMFSFVCFIDTCQQIHVALTQTAGSSLPKTALPSVTRSTQAQLHSKSTGSKRQSRNASRRACQPIQLQEIPCPHCLRPFRAHDQPIQPRTFLAQTSAHPAPGNSLPKLQPIQLQGIPCPNFSPSSSREFLVLIVLDSSERITSHLRTYRPAHI